MIDSGRRVDSKSPLGIYLKPRSTLLGTNSILFNSGNIFELLILPITLTGSKASLWKGRPPFWPFRLSLAAVVLFFWYQVGLIIFRVINYALDFLPEPSQKKRYSSKNHKKRDEFVNKILKVTRCGASGVDPIILQNDILTKSQVFANSAFESF